jgi:hypothetical protein
MKWYAGSPQLIKETQPLGDWKSVFTIKFVLYIGDDDKSLPGGGLMKGQ